MSDTTCLKCNKEFKGFGDVCSQCRKAGVKSRGTARACDACGCFFSGFGAICDDCQGKGIAGGGGGGKQWDRDGCPVEDSNMAGVGGDEDKALRKAAAGGEPAWEGVGLEPGVWVWRIEAFKVVAWPREKYGQFHEGDSYIVLQVEFDFDEETGERSEALQYDIHFWLGKKTSTDEKGTAAYKTVELDSFFDDAAIQHREVQGSESEAFHSFFPSGVEYLPGGVDSGFKVTQQDIFTSKLTQVRRNEKKKIVFEEEAVRLESLNHRDAWILEKGRDIYVWFGNECSPFVKNAANMRAENMERNSHGELTKKDQIDDGFWEVFGGQPQSLERNITSACDVGEEVEADFGEGVLYNIQVDEDRNLTVTEVARGELDRSQLDTTGVMMVDTRSEIFLWLGKETTNVEKGSAFATASNYLKMNDRDVDKTSITVLKEGSDSKNKPWMKMFPALRKQTGLSTFTQPPV